MAILLIGTTPKKAPEYISPEVMDKKLAELKEARRPKSWFEQQILDIRNQK